MSASHVTNGRCGPLLRPGAWCRIADLDPAPRNEAVLQLLSPPLFRQMLGQAEVLEKFRKLPCIPTAAGRGLAAPQDLFDVRNAQLAQALGTQATLPAEPFTSNQACPGLVTVPVMEMCAQHGAANEKSIQSSIKHDVHQAQSMHLLYFYMFAGSTQVSASSLCQLLMLEARQAASASYAFQPSNICMSCRCWMRCASWA